MGNTVKTVIAVCGGAASYFFGGWSSLLGILLVFVVIDYLTGWLSAGINGELNSKVGFKGIAKKVSIFVLVGVANLVDISLGNTHLLRDATIFFYMANELLSMVENISETGLPLPPGFKKAIAILKNKGDIDIEENPPI